MKGFKESKEFKRAKSKNQKLKNSNSSSFEEALILQ